MRRAADLRSRPRDGGSRASALHGLGDRRMQAILCVTCFLSGGLTLVIEIAGNRLLAPLFGNSLHTWTALIGVVLLAMSLGDCLGGLLVDRVTSIVVPGYTLLAAAFWTELVPLIQRWLPGSPRHAGPLLGPLLASLALFAVPACLLAAVGPCIVRLLSRTRDDHAIGLSAGLVGMLSTLGSFTGTLVTGFYLIPQWGVRVTFVAAGLLAATIGTAVVAWNRPRSRAMLAAAGGAVLIAAAVNMLGAAPPPPGVLHEEQTFYHDLRVEESQTELGERIRTLRLDTTLEGRQYVETGGIALPCNLYWRLAEVFCPRLDRGLFLGGGGFAMPEDFVRRHPDATVDVCEIDPVVIRLGRRFFRLDEFPRIAVFACDARRFLVDHDERYDLIFGDVYHGVRNIPSHLVTSEFFALVKSRLSDDGLYLMNIISPLQGEHAQLFHAILMTLRTHFAHTEAYAMNPASTTEPQNILLLAATRQPARQHAMPAEEVTRFLVSTRLPDGLCDGGRAAVLTDDCNAAELLVTEQLLFHPPDVEP